MSEVFLAFPWAEWGGMWLGNLSGQEGPEFSSFLKASSVTTEKLQEGGEVVQSVSIDADSSVFNKAIIYNL